MKFLDTSKAAEVGLFLLRFVSGLLFMQHGGQKIFSWFGGMPGGPPSLSTQIGIGGSIEFTCGLLIMIGLLTRPAAFLASGTMAVAYWQMHYKAEAFWPLQNRGVPAVLFCFIFFMYFLRGGGSWSLDALIFRKADMVADAPAESA